MQSAKDITDIKILRKDWEGCEENQESGKLKEEPVLDLSVSLDSGEQKTKSEEKPQIVKKTIWHKR